MYRIFRTLLRLMAAILAFIAVFSLSLFITPTPQARAQSTTGVDLMLVIDGSGSISSSNFVLERDFARSLLGQCSIRAGAIQFSSTSSVVSPLTSNLADVDAALVAMTQLRGNTDIGAGLTSAFQQFQQNGQPGNRQVVVLLTDGASSGSPAGVAAPFKSAGGEIFGVGVGLSDMTQITAIASSPASKYVFSVNDFNALPTILAQLALGACGPSPAPSPSVLIPEDPADLYAVFVPTPNHGAAAGTIVSYTFKIVNIGPGLAKNSTVTVPLNPAAVDVVDATFSAPSGWVTAVTTDTLTFETGPLGGKGGTITGTIRLRVKDNASAGSWLTNRAIVRWRDDVDGGIATSNLPIVAVARANDSRPAYTLSVDPTEGVVGTTFTFSSGLFTPKEPVGVWYNTPNGSVVAGPTYYAKDDGSLTVAFTDANLVPGAYSMVFYGHWTEITATTPFIVK